MTEVCPPAARARWHADALWRQLEPLLPGLDVEIVARIGSTNTELLSRVRSGMREADGALPARGRRRADLQPTLLVAEQQTHGRGRLGRDWQSSAQASLTFSLALPLATQGAGDWSGLSLAVGVALADALEPARASAPRLLLKWPNDLWLGDDAMPAGGRKLGGILIETAAVGEQRVAANPSNTSKIAAANTNQQAIVNCPWEASNMDAVPQHRFAVVNRSGNRGKRMARAEVG